MSEIADRNRKVAGAFTERVRAVPDDKWDDPSPCEEWVARDVVAHLVEWMPGYLFATWEIDAPEIPPVDDDPVAAWVALSDAVQAALDDPEIAGAERDTQLGRMSFEQLYAMVGLADVLIHTWDLARAAGLDDTLDADEVSMLLAGMSSFDDEMMRSGGMFGPAVEVPDDADDQTKLIAFTGRTP